MKWGTVHTLHQVSSARLKIWNMGHKEKHVHGKKHSGEPTKLCVKQKQLEEKDNMMGEVNCDGFRLSQTTVQSFGVLDTSSSKPTWSEISHWFSISFLWANFYSLHPF